MNSVVVIGLLIAICVNTNDGAVSVMPVKLGTNVDIDFGKEVKAVRIDVNGERKHIVEDGALTEFGAKKFGGRAKFVDGKLTIDNLHRDDIIDFFYETDKYPMAITLSTGH